MIPEQKTRNEKTKKIVSFFSNFRIPVCSWVLCVTWRPLYSELLIYPRRKGTRCKEGLQLQLLLFRKCRNTTSNMGQIHIGGCAANQNVSVLLSSGNYDVKRSMSLSGHKNLPTSSAYCKLYCPNVAFYFSQSYKLIFIPRKLTLSSI